MVLLKYDKRLMELLYLLTKKRKYMNSIEISRNMKISGKSVTDRTVRRWFKYLHKHHFDYFPRPRYDSLGLQNIWVLSDMDEKILKMIPHKLDIVKGVDLGTFKNCFLVVYLIPKENIRQFKNFWSTALKKGLISYCHIFEFGCPVDFYSPFHELIDENGKLIFPQDYSIKHQYFQGLLKKSLEEDIEIKMHDYVKKNPFVVPLLFEHFREHWSSHQVWRNLKRKIGHDVWKYIKHPRTRRQRKDGAGIRFAQETSRYLYRNFDEFFGQMRVVYYPLYLSENTIFYLLLKLKKKGNIAELAELLSNRSLSIVVYPPMNRKSKIVMFYILTNKSMSMDIMSNLIQPYINETWDNKIILEDFKGSLKYWRRSSRFWNKHYIKANYHRLFDPDTCTWKFDAKKYMRKLK